MTQGGGKPLAGLLKHEAKHFFQSGCAGAFGLLEIRPRTLPIDFGGLLGAAGISLVVKAIPQKEESGICLKDWRPWRDSNTRHTD
jgi:hypothetical protein